MSFIGIVGTKGRMTQALVGLLNEKAKAFKNFDRSSTASTLTNCEGLIDFSTTEATSRIVSACIEARVPLVCGTTGWKGADAFTTLFEPAAKKIPIVWDSNFSIGVEQLCQASESIAKAGALSVRIVDIHHIHKKDSPSGTALKIEKRIRTAAPSLSISIDSKREGEVFGIHRVIFELGDESIELTHEAKSRRIFAEGAYRALQWLRSQKPGLYSMRDVLKVSQ